MGLKAKGPAAKPALDVNTAMRRWMSVINVAAAKPAKRRSAHDG